ncbi:unnamed protein product [Didymodactylos carnosus]|uniref:LysM domain-containing protein n=1 Tax=Didymodactylos carnosus TaxID=1234261 RepID=A0A8S2DPK7_9BILA|nr:unnamed protein product [Didymodactylos carnosus]CAF3737298.1 unnamed protein product [Didymodactylos carnosus]
MSSSGEINGNPFTTQNFSSEKRSLSEINTTKRTGYGSLAKSQIQPIFYIRHKLEHGETIQRLALRYSVNIQEIKRVNKLWSDSELCLLSNVLIPVNNSQLTILKATYPTLDILQGSSPISNHQSRKTSTSNDDDNESVVSSSTSTSSFNKKESYQDYFSKVDKQICTSKKSLQTLGAEHTRSKTLPSSSSSSSRISMCSSIMGDEGDTSIISHNARLTYPSTANNNTDSEHYQHRKPISSSDVIVNIPQSNSRDKHARAALERIQREKDDIYEL